MSDDMCECICSQEMAMMRLLSFIRQSQSHCTDTECFDLPPGPNSSTSEPDNFFMMTIIIMLAAALYLLRPSSIRRSLNSETDKSPNNHGDGPTGGAPPAPPTIN